MLVLYTLWLSSTLLLALSAASLIPVAVQVACLPMVATAAVVLGHAAYRDPCFRVPFWAPSHRLRSLSAQAMDLEARPGRASASRAVAAAAGFWATVLWGIHYTVAASISSVIFVAATGFSVRPMSMSTSSSESPPMANGSSSSSLGATSSTVSESDTAV